jgi:hypothetical protein
MEPTEMQSHNRATRRESCEDVLGVLGIGNSERLHYLADDMDLEAETAGLILAAIKSGVFARIESQRPVWVQSCIVPDSSRTVLTFEPGAKTEVWPGYYDFEKWYDLEGTQMHNITHWMEFPKPPKKTESV